MFKRIALAGVLILVAAAATAAVVENPATPRDGIKDVTLREMWRAGGDDDEVFFGSIGTVRRGPDGKIYLLDGQLSHVEVYGDSGEHLTTLGREGDGPGEVRNPAAMFLRRNGDVSLLQSFPGRIVTVHPDGTPAGEIKYQVPEGVTAGAFNVLNSGESITGSTDLLLLGIRMTMEGALSNQTFFLARCDATGKEKTSYLTKEYGINYADFRLDEGKMDFVWSRYAIDAAGNVYTAPERGRYLIRVQAPDGTVVREITRAYASHPREADDRQRATQIMEAIGSYYPTPLKGTTIEDTEPAINGMVIDDDGNLLVGCSDRRDLPADVFAALDVFDPQGHYLRRLQIHCPGDPAHDGLSFVGGGRVIQVRGALDAWLNQQGVAKDDATTAEAPALEVVCFAMP